MGLTPLHYAAIKGSLATLALLLEKGAKSEAGDNKNQTPLNWAELKGHKEAADLLRKAAAKSE